MEVAIVGAGIAGCSAAAALADFCQVSLFEREAHPAIHSTGRSAAYFAPAYGNAVVRELTVAGDAFFRTPPDGFPSPELLRPRDALFIARETQRNSIEALAAETPHLTRLSGQALRAQVPILDTNVITAGLLDTSGGDLDVAALVRGFLAQLRANGGTATTQAGIQAIRRDGPRWTLLTPSGEFSCDAVVNAAGAWADEVASLAGVGPLGLEPRRRTALTVDPPSPHDTSDWPLTIDADERFYFKPEAGRLLLSPADETLSPPCDAQPEELDVALAIDRIQQVAELPVTRVHARWAGLRTFAPDRTFVIGEDPRADGFFWLAGQGGYGVQSCAGVADLVRFALGADHARYSTLTRDDAARLLKETAPSRLLT